VHDFDDLRPGGVRVRIASAARIESSVARRDRIAVAVGHRRVVDESPVGA